MTTQAKKLAKPPAAYARIIRGLCSWLLRRGGWTYHFKLPESPKYVIIGAPHTSNWDFVLMFLVSRAAGLRVNWVGKDSLFKGPMGNFMHWLGGVRVNRSSRNNFVQAAIQAFEENEELHLILAPEGTRSKTGHWKSGFYFIALGARVPILLAAVDFPSRHLQVDFALMPTGNVKADMDIVRAYYAGKRGKFPDQQGEIRLQAEIEPDQQEGLQPKDE